MYNIHISDVSWDSFLVSWQAEEGAFEGFVVELIDAEAGAEWQNHTLSANARSLGIVGLTPSTWYKASLYGAYRGGLLEPMSAETITGIPHSWRPGTLVLSSLPLCYFLLYLFLALVGVISTWSLHAVHITMQ